MATVVAYLVLFVQNTPLATDHNYFFLSSYQVFWYGLNLINDGSDSCDKFDDDYTMALVYALLVCDTCLYLLVYQYFGRIFPGKAGQAESWQFPFEYLASLWRRFIGQKEHVNYSDRSIKLRKEFKHNLKIL